MAKKESRFALRMPDDMYNLVKERAEQAGISMNEFVVSSIAAQLRQADEKIERYLSLEERKLITLEERVAAIEKVLRFEDNT